MSIEIVFKNLDEFIENIREVEKTFPDLSEKYLRRIGNTLKRNTIAASPVGKAPLQRWNRGKLVTNRKKLKLSWTGSIKRASLGAGVEYQLRSKAPHFHLVERGHEHYIFGRYHGYLPGRYFFRKVVKNFESTDELHQQMSKFMDEVAAKLTK